MSRRRNEARRTCLERVLERLVLEVGGAGEALTDGSRSLPNSLTGPCVRSAVRSTRSATGTRSTARTRASRAARIACRAADLHQARGQPPCTATTRQGATVGHGRPCDQSAPAHPRAKAKQREVEDRAANGLAVNPNAGKETVEAWAEKWLRTTSAPSSRTPRGSAGVCWTQR